METTINTIKRTFIDSKLGEVKLKDAVLDRDEITMYFNIESLSDESQARMDEAIKKKAIEKYYRDEERYRKKGLTIKNLKMKETGKLLCFECSSGKIDFHFLITAIDGTGNLETELWFDGNIENFYDEIKNVIFKAIETRYFGQPRKKNVN